MRIEYVELVAVDCTCDPHPVNYGERALGEMLDDIVKVCESPLVQAVESVRLDTAGWEGGDSEYGSDEYGLYNYKKDIPLPNEGMYAKHKVAGRAFQSDWKGDGKHHLPPGLTGVKAAVKIARERGVKYLSIGVVWAFAGDSSCSDYIRYKGVNVVSYDSQDWWISCDGYEQWKLDMGELLGVDFP